MVFITFDRFSTQKASETASNSKSIYDFIIVGAGSAGCALATRIAASRRFSVLLIEAGGVDSNPNIHMPVACGELQKHESIDWMYKAEISKNHSLGLENGQSNWPRGKVVGGCSSINYMAYVRGHPNDFNSWADIVKDDSWNFDATLPFFKKMEGCVIGENEENRNIIIEQNMHGYDGPLTVSTKNPPSEISLKFVEACVEAGFTRGDYNGIDSENKVSLMQHTVRNGERCSTAKAYLNAAFHNHNGFVDFDVLIECQVTKIIVEMIDDKPTVKGVMIIKDLETSQIPIFAKREVILCAGAIGSPHLMMLSGLGPKEELTKYNINVIVDIPNVGKNLEDHLALHVRFDLKRNTLQSVNKNLATNKNVVKEYEESRTGVLSSSAYDATLFYKTGIDPGINVPDMQIGLFISGGSVSLLQGNIGYNDIIKNYFGGDAKSLADDNESFLVVPTLLHPRSKGEIKLRSANPFDKPIIDAGYLSDSENHDLKTLIAGIKRSIEVIQKSKALNGLVEFEPCYPKDVVSLCNNDVTSDKFFEEWIRHYGVTLYHPTSSCAMGKVLDSNCKVIGVSNLRVADASSMPHLTSGNTNAPSILIGEVVASKILTEYIKISI